MKIIKDLAAGILEPVATMVNKGLDKFVSDKMSEADRETLKAKMTMFIMAQATKEDENFRKFVVEYEGAAKDVPRFVVILRALIRPSFTILVGYLDFQFFTGATSTWHPEAIALLKAVNIIVLAFWFGEKALKNSGLVDLLAKRKE